MTVDEIAKLATPLAWPVFALVVLMVFCVPLLHVLRRLSKTLTLRGVKVTALGVEAELSPEYARSVLNELLEDITAASNQLSAEEVSLFDRIREAQGAKTVMELIPDFARGGEDHDRLRNLRDQKLVLPAERGQWKADKHPIVTPYGNLVAKLRTTGAESVREFRERDA
jgi:hypothetical protein